MNSFIRYQQCIFFFISLHSSLCHRYPTLCHQYFDYLQRSNIKASSILGRIDSLILLYDWIRINSNDINVYKDVRSISLPFTLTYIFHFLIPLDE